MNDNERISATLLHTRCVQAGINKLQVLHIFKCLLPSLEEARVNLKERKKSLEDMYFAFDVGEVVEAAGDPDCTHLYPHPSSGITAWSGMYNRALNNQASELIDAERLALKMVNYMTYTECVYANLVNQLCYVMLNTSSPCRVEELRCKNTMESIARVSPLRYRVKFLKQNLPKILNGVPDIIEACNIDLRNMIAHGSLAGGQSLALHDDRQKTEYRSMSEPVYVRGGYRKDWKWNKKPVDLDIEYKKMRDATLTWQTALLYYQDVIYGSWKCLPES